MSKITKKFTENYSKGLVVKEICVQCNRETNHEIVTSYELHGQEDCGGGHTIEWGNSCQVIQCKGCEVLSFREENSCSEDVYQISDDEWDDGTRITLYPKRSEHMIVAKEFDNVPSPLVRIYKESIEAFNNDSFVLAAAGLRALVEGICSYLEISDGPVILESGKIIRKNNLEVKIFGLNERGHLTVSSAKSLHEHRFMGNNAVHALKRSTRGDLLIAIDLLEHSLNEIFEVQAKAEGLEVSRKLREEHL
ncbi:DUF4145 domain-containing protein [Providencia vermicola]|uniref:DUF4145 domain-containing protein n=1 Tax=Providencia vermicola TaxID=333965 RepID=UPI0034DD8852